MPALLLYALSGGALLLVWSRYVERMTRAAAIALLLLPLCFTGRALLTGRVYGPIDLPFMAYPLKDYAPELHVEKMHNGWLADLYCQMIPWQHTVREALSRGEWPLWNPYMLSGSMLAANMQAAPYDPINVTGLLLSQPQSLTYGAAMAFLLAALFTFAFMRQRGCGEWPSLIAAGGYMCSSMLAFFIGWPLGRAWALLPFVLYAVGRVVRDHDFRSGVLLTLSLTLTIFTGHPESVLHIVACGAVFGVYELLRNRRHAARSIAIAVVAGVVTLLLTAVALWPFLSAVRETRENATRNGIYKATPYPVDMKTISLHAGGTFLPFFGGRPELDKGTDLYLPTTSRVGSAILLLALAALVLARRDDTWFFFGAAVFSLLAGMNAPPVAQILHRTPLFDIALNERLAIAAAFSLCVLAGFAIDALPTTRRQAWIAAAVVVIGMAILLVYGQLVTAAQIKAGVDAVLIRNFKIVETLAALLIAGIIASRLPARITVPALLAVVLLQRVFEDGHIYPALPESIFYPKTPILSKMQSDRSGPFRMVGLYYALIPDGAAMYGLEDVRGYEAMTFARMAETYPMWSTPTISFNVVTSLKSPFLSLLNTKYAIVDDPNEPVPDGWSVVMTDRRTRLFRNERVLPRAFVPRRVQYMQKEADIVQAMASATDFGDLAWICAPHYEPHEIANGSGQVTVRRDGGHAWNIGATMDADGWVILTEAAWPGWRAYLDGHRVEPQFADHTFLGVFVPKGRHSVRFVYQPESFKRGRNTTLATIAAAALFLVLRNRLKKPRAV